MKRLLLFICITISTSLGVYSQNLDFENWSSESVLVPDDYKSTINESSYGHLAVLKSNDAFLNSNSIHLKTIEVENDTVFGYFFNGDPETLKGGSRLSLLTGVDSIIGYYKYNLVNNDTALFMCFAKKAGVVTGGQMFKITGSQPTWKRFSIPVDAITADSIIIGAASSNAINQLGIEPGSFLMLDGVQLKQNINIENIPNYSFENWSNISWEEPDDWNTDNADYKSESTKPVAKTSSSNGGNFACTLNTFEVDKDTIRGQILKGEWADDIGNTKGGMPYSKSPNKVRLHYKFLPTREDHAFIDFKFKKDGAVIGFTGEELTDAVSSFTLWEGDVLLMQTPDTVFVNLSSGDNPGTQFIIDDIEFVVQALKSSDVSINQVIAFPIPATDFINFEVISITSKNLNIDIFNSSGKTVISKSIILNENTKKFNIDISGLSKGKYVYKLKVEGKDFVNSFIKR